VNLTGLFNHSFYLGYLGDTLGAVKAHFQDEVRGVSSFFRFSLPLSHPGWYNFFARSFGSGLNFTYWVDTYSNPHVHADTLDGSSLFATEIGGTSLFVNQSIIPLPSTTPQTETLGGTVLLVNVQFNYACGCTCGISDVWFLMNAQWAIISVIFSEGFYS
jgi:hypothetical protein